MTTDEIQTEIERTRTVMADTLNAIERKLSPGKILDQAVNTMHELAHGQSRVGHLVRENPIPLALIGLGVGWMAMNGKGIGKKGKKILEESYESMEGIAEEVPLERKLASSLGEDLAQKTTRAVERSKGVFEEYPLAMGAMALLAGVALSAMISKGRHH